MSPRSTDQQLHLADALAARIKDGSLGEYVEWLTAFAICFRAVVVNGESPDPDINKIAQEMVEGLTHGLPEVYDGDDAEEKRRLHGRVERFVAAMKPEGIADLMDEMAESFREVLLSHRPERLRRFRDGLEADIALAGNAVVHELVRLDRDRALAFEPVDEERSILADCAPASTT